jgi:hypothetical protein
VLDAAVFAADSRNLIHFEQKGYFAGYENVARARSLGGELSLDVQAVRVVHLYLKGTAIDARDRSGDAAHDGRRLPQLPALRGYLRPELRDLPIGRGFAAGLYGELESTSHRFQDRANETPQPGRTILGAGASLAYRPAQLRAVFSAYNLGNQLAPTCWISPRRAVPSSSRCNSPIPNRRTIDDYPSIKRVWLLAAIAAASAPAPTPTTSRPTSSAAMPAMAAPRPRLPRPRRPARREGAGRRQQRSHDHDDLAGGAGRDQRGHRQVHRLGQRDRPAVGGAVGRRGAALADPARQRAGRDRSQERLCSPGSTEQPARCAGS